MSDGQLIEFDHVTKRFGAVAAVSDFSARVNPGVVTGFLGPNGAGKTTTLRMLVGLERPTIGTTKIGGKRFSELREPARVIGAMLENPGFRARRTVERHLTAAAKANSIPTSRVAELISFVGLGSEVETRIAALSLGMRQRLSAATALLGDPGVLVLDEPANGLDPEGIRWMRTLIRGLADEGRTVLVSSHVLSEVEQTADEILVIASGELKFAGTMEDLADPSTGPVVVDAADRSALSTALRDAGFEFEILRSGLTVRGSDAPTIGAVTAGAGVALTTLQQRGPTLEDVFLDLVNDRYVRPVAVSAGAAANAAPEAAADAAPEAFAPAPDADADADADESAAESAEPATALLPTVGASGSADESIGDEALSDVAAAPSDVEDSATSDVVDPEPASADAAPADDDGSEHTGPVASPAPEEDDRPLPGIAGLAAVASLFNTPPSAPATEETADADADAGDIDADGDADDLDATRAITVVSGAENDVEPTSSDTISDSPFASSEASPSSASDAAADEVDATDEFFDAFTGDPSSDDDADADVQGAASVGESDDTASEDSEHIDSARGPH